MNEMDPSKTALERAFDLARSGRFLTVSALKKAVADEGYARSQLDGPALSRQLGNIIKSHIVPDPD